ncbi:MAG: hypothetical protein ACOY3E_11965 [Pseudomonadota bacterium]
MNIKSLTALVLASAVLFSNPLFADTETDKKIEQLLSTFADKPEEHKALAALYREQAADSREKAERHRKVKERYASIGGKPGTQYVGMRAHCDKLIKSFEESAKSFDAMADDHDKMGSK